MSFNLLKPVPGGIHLRLALYSLIIAGSLATQSIATSARQSEINTHTYLSQETNQLTLLTRLTKEYRLFEALVQKKQEQGEVVDELLALQKTIGSYLRNGKYADAQRLLSLGTETLNSTATPVPSVLAIITSDPQPTPSPVVPTSNTVTSTSAKPIPAPSPTQSPTQLAPTAKPSIPPTPTPAYSSSKTLTIAGIIYWTNQVRQQYNLPPLTENTKLNQAATIRIGDMFTKQKFAHDYPSAITYGEAVKEVEYNWHSIAENIASATAGYLGDQKFVDMWMNSPGHRTNILNPVFTEIGIGVGDGPFDGESTAMAVQIFGTP